MRFVEIGDKFLNLDNVTDVSISVDRIGIKRMAVRFRERRVKLSPEETKGFDRWLRNNNLLEEIKSGTVRYPTMDVIERRLRQDRT